MKQLSKLLFIASVLFLIITAVTAKKGVDYEYRKDTFGWPNRILTVTYEKTSVSNLEIDFPNMALNWGICFAAIAIIRLFFLMLKVKRKINEDDTPTWQNHPYFKDNQIKIQNQQLVK